MLLNSAVYVDGRHTVTPATLEEAYRICRQPGSFAWIALREPTGEELASAIYKLGLDEPAVEEASMPQQRPKLERYGAACSPFSSPFDTMRIERKSSTVRYTPSWNKTLY